MGPPAGAGLAGGSILQRLANDALMGFEAIGAWLVARSGLRCQARAHVGSLVLVSDVVPLAVMVTVMMTMMMVHRVVVRMMTGACGGGFR